MKRSAFVALALLAACSAKTHDAEEQYAIVSNSGSVADKCVKAREVQQSFLSAHDEQGYAKWKKQADTDCGDVTLESANLPANPKEQSKAIEAEADAALANAEAALKAHRSR